MHEPGEVMCLEEGTKKAYATAEKTLDEVKSSMKINYFKDNSPGCLFKQWYF